MHSAVQHVILPNVPSSVARLLQCSRSSRQSYDGIQVQEDEDSHDMTLVFSIVDKKTVSLLCVDVGEVMGKVEGHGESWHGHVTAVTVSPEYRRQKLAKKLMNVLEEISEKTYNAYFVDLFVRASNTPAINMYGKLGYVVYRRVLRYYSDEEDGLDMRKALPRDVEKKSIIPMKHPITPEELEFY